MAISLPIQRIRVTQEESSSPTYTRVQRKHRAFNNRGVKVVDTTSESTGKAEFEGYTREQFMFALESVSGRIADEALRAKAGCSMGTEESEAFLDDILSAES